MKGIVFNLLEQVVIDEHGEETWDRLLETSGVDGAFSAVGTYSHHDLHRLVDAAAQMLDADAGAVQRWFGRNAIPLLQRRYPDFFSPHTSVRAFALTLNEIIHPEVRKLFPGAYAPEFDVELVDEDTVSLGYHSHRGLCRFAEGLLEGAAAFYEEAVNVSQTVCTLRGDDQCILQCMVRRG